MAKVFQVDSGGTLTTNLVAYYKLEDANDFWSTYDLTNTGGVTFITGKVLNGANFGEALDRYLGIDSALGIDGGVISIAGWFKVTAQPVSGAYQGFAGQANNVSKVFYSIHYYNNAGTLQLIFRREKPGIATNDVTVNTTLALNTWYHIALVYNGSTLEGFLNNVSQGTIDCSGNGSLATPTKVTIGAFIGNSDNEIEGMIDEVGIWSKSLSVQERTDLYNGGAGQTMIELISQTCTETIVIVDSIVRTTGRILLEVVTVVDTLTKVRTYQRLFAETITIVDSILKQIGRIFSEVVTIVDPTITTTKVTTKELLESIIIVDTFTRVISKVYSEVVTIVDSVVRQTGRTFSEIVTIVDSILGQGGKILTEVVTITDSITRQFQRVFEEVVTITDSFTKITGKIFTETVLIVDSFIRQAGKVLTEPITITDIRDFFKHARGLIFGSNKNTGIGQGTPLR